MLELEQKVQEEDFEVEVQYCDPDNCLYDCVIGSNICNAQYSSFW